MGKMSRDKGARGERSVAALFREYGYDASRTAQHCGKTGQAPDISGIPLIHAEVKYQEKMHLYDWMAQAVRDSEAEGKGNKPVVFHKQNNKDLLVTMRWADWIEMFTEYEAGQLTFGEKGSDRDGL